MTVLLGAIPTSLLRLRSKYVSLPTNADNMFSMPRCKFSQRFAIESSRSSITPGAPEFSILTTRSASSAGPVIWLRWSTHHDGNSTCQACMVATDGGRKLDNLPACDCVNATSRRWFSARWRRVRAACSGVRNSRKPFGKSRAALNSAGAEFTGTMRPENGPAVPAPENDVAVAAIAFPVAFSEPGRKEICWSTHRNGVNCKSSFESKRPVRFGREPGRDENHAPKLLRQPPTSNRNQGIPLANIKHLVNNMLEVEEVPKLAIFR